MKNPDDFTDDELLAELQAAYRPAGAVLSSGERRREREGRRL